MGKLLTLLCLSVLTSCSNYGQLTFITKLPRSLDENSGIVQLRDSSIWVVEDNGNPDNIYEVNFKGKFLKEFEVKNAKNGDWEDLAKDSLNNIYIGDIGNNNHQRKDFVIYKIPNALIEPGDKIDAEAIRFSYPELKKGTKKKSKFWSPDAEALFYHNQALYIITKDSGDPFTGEAHIYKVPALPGTYRAKHIGSFVTCQKDHNCEVTAADISPDGKKIALLGYGMLWVYSDFSSEVFWQGSVKSIDLGASTQLESICFKDNNTLLISDEERGNSGRNLYSYKLN